MHPCRRIVFLFIFTATSVAAQQPKIVTPQVFTNDVRQPQPAAAPGKATADCLSAYIPTLSTPILTVALNFHIFQKNDGTNMWQDTPFDRAQLESLIPEINNRYSVNCPPSDPCPSSTRTVTDTRIRFVLKNIYFYRDTALNAALPFNEAPLFARALADHPAAKNQLNILFNQDGPNPGYSGLVNTLPSTNMAQDQYIHMRNTYTGGFLNWSTHGTLAHEMGHVLGLLHPYDGGECIPNACDYLSDLVCGGACPQDGGWGTDPTAPGNTATNNIMGGVRDSCFITDRQAARMQRALQTLSTKRYLEPSGCVPPPADMVLWLPLDEPGGGTALNPLGTAGTRTGTINVVNEVATRGICFASPAPPSVDVPHYSDISIGAGPFTIEAWVKRMPGDNGKRVVVEKKSDQNGSVRGIALLLEEGYPLLELSASTTTALRATVKVPDDNTWHHVAATFVRVDPNGARFYIDGTQAGVPLSTMTLTAPFTAIVPFRVGKSVIGSSSVMQGCIDEVTLYRRALAASEINTIAAARGAGKCQFFGSASVQSVCPAETTVATSVRVCNASATSRIVSYAFAGEPAAGSCTVAGPTTFLPFATGLVSVAAGSCINVSTTISRPSGLTTQAARSCYRFDATSNGAMLTVRGALEDQRLNCGPPH
ncbi:MAG: hypothetical protein QOI58_3892 [Thermoanaerobaculia bacterium]|jgi:hypothetical protein|nr:hypothetical protein [Thermoanaerobaculia bacterium]